MKENKELAAMRARAVEFAQDVAELEDQGMTMMVLRAGPVCAARDYIARLENHIAHPEQSQASRAQRTTSEAFAKLSEDDFMAIWNELGGDDKWLKSFGYYQFGFAVQDAICDRIAAPVADTEQATDDDLLDVVRTFCSIAARMRELTPQQRAHYPAPTSEGSPLLAAARAACVARGYTEDGLAVEGVSYPLATPADAGAGLNERALLASVQSTERYHQIAGRVRSAAENKFHDVFQIEMAELIEYVGHIARMSTPGAQVTASDAGGKANAECLLEEVAQLRQVIAGFAVGARQAASGDEVEMFLRWCDQVKLPIDAPDGSFSMRAFRWAKVAWLYRAALDNHSEELLDMAGQSPAPVTAEPAQTDREKMMTLQGMADCMHMVQQELIEAGVIPAGTAPMFVANAVLAHIATHSAPADRDAIHDEAYEDAALQCEAEKVHVQKWHPSSDGDEAYNAGCDDCAKAIRALKSMERAADAAETRDAKGGDDE